MPNTLWVVATPIGNLEDMSDRARRILGEVDAVVCEDTRQTAKLLSAFGISAQGRLSRLDAHSSASEIRRWVDRIEAGESVALVTDAGTPSVSDPGAKLVAECREKGISVTAVPGPSAVAALLSVSGFLATEFAFRGFFPRKESDQRREISLARVSTTASVFIWFESPHRIAGSLRVFSEECADLPGIKAVAAKEMTKLHEKFFHGDLKSVASQVSAEVDQEGPKGEWCFAISFPPIDSEKRVLEEKSSEWVKVLQCLMDAQVSASVAARQVSQHFGAPRKEAYELALKIAGKKK